VISPTHPVRGFTRAEGPRCLQLCREKIEKTCCPTTRVDAGRPNRKGVEKPPVSGHRSSCVTREIIGKPGKGGDQKKTGRWDSLEEVHGVDYR